MKRSTSLLVAAVVLAVAAQAQAGRPRGIQVLDSDTLLLPYVEQENLYRLTYFRSAAGTVMLLDASDVTPMRVTPLGFTPPLGSNKGSYTATPDDTVWAAFSSPQRIRVYDLGDIAKPGALSPGLVDAIAAPSGYDPNQTQLGIIAILIGLVAEPRPALFVAGVQDGTSNTLVLGYDGERFRPVGLMEDDGLWFFLDAPQ
jgi:hypothetical protein